MGAEHPSYDTGRSGDGAPFFVFTLGSYSVVVIVFLGAWLTRYSFRPLEIVLEISEELQHVHHEQ